MSVGARFKEDVRSNLFLMQRMATAWNVPWGMVVEADTLMPLKRLVDMLGKEGYGISAEWCQR